MQAVVKGKGAVVAEERLYSLTEMAESLGLAEPTARRYRDAFEEFLPSVGVGRRRKFTDQAKQTLARIAALVHEQRMPVEVVRRILTSERTQAELNLAPAAALPGNLSDELRSIRAAVAALAERVQEPGGGVLLPPAAGSGMWSEGADGERLAAAFLSLRELVTESVGVILRQMERIQQAQDETRTRLQQLSDDMFRRDEQSQLLMEALADIAARYEQLAMSKDDANGGSRRLWRSAR
jgi:DNA-binding transcriptional MerR regulator